MSVNLTVLSDLITAVAGAGQTVIDNLDVWVSLIILGVILVLARKIGGSFGNMFTGLFGRMGKQ